MSLYKNFATDQNVERNGVVLQYGYNSKKEPIEIRVARAGGSNIQFAKRLEHELRPYKRMIANETMDPKQAEKILISVYADTVVLGWSGVEDREGNAMEFTKDNVVKLFTDLPDLFADVQKQSQNAALYRADIREDEAGN